MQGARPLVLVTGGSGFIAAHIVRQLLDTKEYRVRTTVRKVEKSTKTAHLYKWQEEVGADNLQLVPGDLLSADGWDVAVKDADYVLHTASPFPMGAPKHEDDLIKPAVGGTLNVLNAALKEKSIKRVVVTSSCAAVFPGNETAGALDESQWANVEKCDAYCKSKTLAEKSAWDFIASNKGASFDLATVNPGFVVGPSLTESSDYTSGSLITGIFTGALPALPKSGYPCIDVRDVARAHLSALKLKEAGGKRLLMTEGSYWLKDLAQIMSDAYKPKGYDKMTLNEGGDEGNLANINNAATKKILGFTFKPMKESIPDMVEHLMTKGSIPRN